MISEIRNCSALETPSQNAAQSLMMVVTSKPNDTYESFVDEVRKYNKEPPFMFPQPDILNNLTLVRSRLDLSSLQALMNVLIE